MTIIADTHTFLVGIDTHARGHTFAVVEARTGAPLDTQGFPATPAGLRRAFGWIDRPAHLQGLGACGPSGWGCRRRSTSGSVVRHRAGVTPGCPYPSAPCGLLAMNCSASGRIWPGGSARRA